MVSSSIHWKFEREDKIISLLDNPAVESVKKRIVEIRMPALRGWRAFPAGRERCGAAAGRVAPDVSYLRLEYLSSTEINLAAGGRRRRVSHHDLLVRERPSRINPCSNLRRAERRALQRYAGEDARANGTR